MADRSPDDGPGNHRAPSIECCWTSVDIVGGWVHAKRRVAARSPAPWRTCQNADVDCNGGGDAVTDRPQTPGMGDHRPAIGRGRKSG